MTTRFASLLVLCKRRRSGGGVFWPWVFGPSYQTLQFLISSASRNARAMFDIVLGTFDGVAVLEFTPHEADAAR